MHAEVDAMKKLDKKYKKKAKRKKQVDLLVIRIGRIGDLRSSRPCHKCLELLNRMKGYRIRHIYYSTDEGTIVRERFNDLYERRYEYKTRRFIGEFY